MDEKNGKVSQLGDYKHDARSEGIRDEIVASTSHDMGKAGLIISLLTAALLAVLFFGLNQNLAGLDSRVEELKDLQANVAAMDAKVASIDDRIAVLERLPQEARKVILGSMLDEMSAQAGIVSGQLNDDGMSAKLIQAVQLMQEVRSDLGK